MKPLIQAYDAARNAYTEVEFAVVTLLKDTLRCSFPGRTAELANLTNRWFGLSDRFQVLDEKMDDLKRGALAPLMGFYIGDLVTVRDEDSGRFYSALVSNLCMPYVSVIEEVDASEFEFQVFLEPAECLSGFWVSPERGGSIVIAGTLKEIVRLIKRKDGPTPSRSVLNANARQVLVGLGNSETLERMRLMLLKNLGENGPCVLRNEVVAAAALEQEPHRTYPQWQFEEGDLVLARFKDETSWRHIVFLYIDMQTSRQGVLHYFDGEVFAMTEEIDPFECKKPMAQVAEMALFMPKEVHEIESDGAVGHILLAAFAQRENLRGQCGRWALGYQEPRHVARQRVRLKVRKENGVSEFDGNED